MADTKQVREAGKLLGADLKAIREARHIGKDKILEATRLPRDVVDEFDRSCLVDHPAFNKVYLQSIARSYAGVLGLLKEEVQEAVSDALAGIYDGSLGRRYLEQPVGTAEEADAAEEGENVAESEEGEKADESGAAEESVESGEGEEATVSGAAEESVESGEGEKATESGASEKSENSEDSASSDHPHRAVEKRAFRHSRLEGALAEQVGHRTGKALPGNSLQTRITAIRNGLLLPNLRGFIPAVAVIVVLAIFLWYLLFGSTGKISDEPIITAEAPDSIALEQIAPRFLLPDTLVFEIIASQERLDPIRVTIDSDMRRPYWIEYLDTMRVAVIDSVLFEREAAVASIRLFDYEIPDSMLDERGRINVTRHRAQHWLDAERAIQSGQ